ncbi:MAG: glycosyltransferase involved in cell wall biosynthesis [Glaciecola sp.]|jgi:glycosyltransferase involved in cell wall biosynthesis|uniref:glycosyltransferase family 2 protein n=1 Tax=Congregibacter sp. TaxID=2744308 RepID=UPI0039E48E16
MTKPLVSICVPVLNGERHLAETLDSALKQTYKNIEVVAVDNNSSDGTSAILEAFSAQWGSRLKVFRNAETQGMATNFNIAVAHSRGAFLKLLPHDDVLTPESVEVLMRERSENDALIVGLRDFILSSASFRERLSYRNLNRFWRADKVFGSGAIAPDQYLKIISKNTTHNVIGEPANVIISRAAFEAVGGFTEPFQQLCDLRLWHAIGLRYGIRVVATKVAFFRVHEGSHSNASRYDEGLRESLLIDHSALSEYVLQYTSSSNNDYARARVRLNVSLDNARLRVFSGHEQTNGASDDSHYWAAKHVVKLVPLKRVYQLIALRIAMGLFKNSGD